jgi:hypothetical protein
MVVMAQSIPSPTEVCVDPGAPPWVRTGEFGWSVALSVDGSTALIGAPGDTCDPCGAAWVFTRSGFTSVQQGPKLTPSDEVVNGFDAGLVGGFGESVSLSADGNTALIGDPNDTSVGGVGIFAAGAVWVFTRSGSAWAQEGRKLIPSSGGPSSRCLSNCGESFGLSVALSAAAGTALVGGIEQAWVLRRSGYAWIQQGPPLAPSDEADQGNFGESAA